MNRSHWPVSPVLRRLSPLIAVSLLLAVQGVYSASFLEQGVTALRNNEPDRAKALFEASLNQKPGDEKTLLYLGVAELQLGDLAKAVATFKNGMSSASSLKDAFCYNLGNVYFMQEQNALAEGMYSQAIKTNPNLADAYLNRANARMKLKNYGGAESDYTVYLSLNPQAPQQAEIEKLIGLLKAAKAEAERTAKLAEEKKKAAEARQQALLNQVLQSLGNASNDTKNLQAGTPPLENSKVNLGLAD